MDQMYQLPFKVGQTAEARCLEVGYRGAWFRCKIQKISLREGHWSALLQYFDYPDDECLWTECLMLRPEYPPEHLNNKGSDVATVVEGTWEVGSMVDWWSHGCYWSGKVTKLLDHEKAQIELVAPPLGEGGYYEVLVKDLRPSLNWSLEFGWAAPASQDGESSCHAALLKNPGKPTSKRNSRSLEMVGADKGKKIMVFHTKKRTAPVNPRRSTGIHISEPQPNDIPPRASLSATRLSQQSQTAPTHVGPPHGYPRSLSTAIMVSTLGYSTLQGYSHLPPEAAMPSTSGNQSATLTSSGSVGRSGLRLRDTVSELDTPMAQHPDVLCPQSGDIDANQRIIIEPDGFKFKPDNEISTIIVAECVKPHYETHCTGFWPTWSTIPADDQQQMFNEFKKYFVWAPEHDAQIETNFYCRAAKRLHDLFWRARKYHRIPDFVPPDVWTRLLSHWATDKKFRKRSKIGKKARAAKKAKRSKIGKKARASKKGGSLHTSGAVSQTTVRKRREKDLDRPITQEELLKASQTKRKKNSTNEDRWIEPQAQQIHERFVQKVEEYRITLPPESRSTPLTPNQVEQFWKESEDDQGSSSRTDGVNKAVVVAMGDTIATLTGQLAAAAKMLKKNDEQLAAERQKSGALKAELGSIFSLFPESL